MVFKTPKKVSVNQKGFTYIELIVVIAIISVGIYTVSVLVNPAEVKARARDQKRLSDIVTLETAINEFRIDNGRYPELGELIPDYLSSIPEDPINDVVYFYNYAFTDFGYELNARLEYYQEYAQNDGGTDPEIYEVGNDLTII